MLTNPYPPPRDDDLNLSIRRFQTYLSAEDKALLTALRPDRSTAQCVINHLIKNLCDELRRLNITSYHPDADDILGVLIEPRNLTAEQLHRIGRTTAGAVGKVPKGVQHSERGSGVRKTSTDTPTGAHHPKGGAESGKRPNGEKTSGEKKSSHTKAGKNG